MANRNREDKRAYKKYLVEFMSFRNQQRYNIQTEFTQQQLTAIRPADIERWMCQKVYGNPNPGPQDNPTLGRASSLEYYKKALSYYMVNRLHAWNEVALLGNPTRSVDVNDLIKKVKKKEVRKQGKKSSARRGIQKPEFESTVAMLNDFPDMKRKYMVPTAAKFQFHMVARIDDTCNFTEEDLKPNPQFPFTLLAKMCWSKNVLEERDAPDQIVIGAMDRRYCILLALGIYLEVWMESEIGAANQYLFGHADNAETTKKFVSDVLSKDVWDAPGFHRVVEGPLGTHSVRKFPTTHARRNGCSKDDVDSRGRWRKRRMVDRYIDVNLPYPDAKVAAALCVGGPCKYVLKEGSGVTEHWLRQHVVPNILRAQRFQEQVVLVLALPILWACFDDEMVAYMPAVMRNRIRAAYENIRQLEPEVNPVKKILLLVTGVDAEVYIDEINDMDVDGGVNNAAGNAAAAQAGARNGAEANHRALYAQLTAGRREVQELRGQLEHYEERMTRRFGLLNNSIRRIAIQPARRRAIDNNNNNNNDNNDNNAAPPVENEDGPGTLSPNPRDLHSLWQEYEFGIGGRKAARLFTAVERGRVKYTYHRRKVVWDQVALMIRAGYTAQTAIDRIYEVHGVNRNVTYIINQMRRDRMTGGNPLLNV
jgi:hypothetical protein